MMAQKQFEAAFIAVENWTNVSFMLASNLTAGNGVAQVINLPIGSQAAVGDQVLITVNGTAWATVVEDGDVTATGVVTMAAFNLPTVGVTVNSGAYTANISILRTAPTGF